jgi:hypothetical protein
MDSLWADIWCEKTLKRQSIKSDSLTNQNPKIETEVYHKYAHINDAADEVAAMTDQQIMKMYGLCWYFVTSTINGGKLMT